MKRNLIAILRGITHDKVKQTANVLIDAGFEWIEVTLNSPDPFKSIEILAKNYGNQALIGAGTVCTEEDVKKVHDVGGKLIISPNLDKEVIEATKKLNMLSIPGVLTPSECIEALKYGADILKVFPATMLGAENLKAIRAVLPQETQIYMVGGIGPENIGTWIDAGANGFSVGGILYKPTYSLEKIATSAKEIIASYDRAMKK